jgi:ribosomal protein S18 acetylase RimI-like enzyme
MQINIGFRRAEKKDSHFLLRLRKSSMNEHLACAGIFLSDEQHLQRINEFFNDSHIIVQGNNPIGLIKLGVIEGQLHIRQFQILPKFHGLGIGGKVLEIIKRKAIEKRMPITLNVLLDNPAKNLYLRHDFVICGGNELEFQMRWELPLDAINN